MITTDEYLFSSKETLDAALSDQVVQVLARAIAAKGQAVLVLSGGNTPGKMLERLSRKKISWENVTVLLADERWVEVDSDRSNERMIRHCFLKNAASTARFQGFYVRGLDVKKAPDYWEDRLNILDLPVDVSILGMGEDGHTASLFPCADNIEELLSSESQLKTVRVSPQTAPDTRISLSFPVLKTSENIFVHFTGELKKEIFQKIISGTLKAPLGRILEAAEGKTKVYWAS